MPEYRIYLFTDGRIAKGETVEVADDALALNIAFGLSNGGGFEVWRGAQMIVSHDAPLPTLDAWSPGAMKKPD
jgi:hypothetical protein